MFHIYLFVATKSIKASHTPGRRNFLPDERMIPMRPHFLDSVRNISQRFTVPYDIGGGAEPVLNHTEICPARKFKIDPCVEMTEYEVIYVLTLPKRFGKFVERFILASEDILGFVPQAVML